MLTQNNTEKIRPGSSLGTITVLPDTFSKFDKMKNTLKANNDKGLRDNYTLSEVSKNVIKIYERNQKKYIKYVKIPKGKTLKEVEKYPSFSRNLFCQNILEDYSIVKKTIEHESIINTNIAHCSSVWTCPVCASIIQSRRADEVQTAVDWATSNGYKTIMVTFTASHTAKYPLNEFGTKIQQAYEKMHNQLRHYRKKYEVGSIKSVEFTYSRKNGWHKHFHVIFFLKETADIDLYFSKIKKSWQHQCLEIGLLEPNEKAIADFDKHGCSLTENAAEAVADYTNKSANEWTISDEMTKSVLKIGKSSAHMTPFQMLVNIATDETSRDFLIDKFIEYMLHTKNAHQIDWSCGLKVKVGIVDKTNEELLAEEKDKSINIAALTVVHWHLLQSKYLRIEYLKAAKDEGFDGIVAFFEKHADDDLPDVLPKCDADLLDSFDEDTATESEKQRYEILKTVLAAIKESIKTNDNSEDTYSVRRFKKPQKENVLTDEEKKSVRKSRERVEKYYSESIREFADFEPKKIVSSKTPAEMRADWVRRHPPTFDQLNLIG
jgi:hypothetical protein